jgi:rRNA-processing protein FCF1
MIILDTNFIIYAIKYKLAHNLEEYKNELAVPEQVVFELEMLSSKSEKIKDREDAKLGLLLIEKWNVKVLNETGNADDAIEKLAQKTRAKVATMDKILVNRLKKTGIKILKIRQKTKLIFE